MLKNWMRDITLAIQAKSGATLGVFIYVCIVILTSLTTFIFLCVAGYDWIAAQEGSVLASLMMAGIFAIVAALAAIVCAVARHRAKERATLERIARARSPAWFLDPKIFGAAVEAGRTLGWQRIVPVVLLGFMAAQWAREHRERER